jgi:hypothetical protein
MSTHTDVRLIAVSQQHIDKLRSDDADEIISGLRYVLLAYEESPPLSLESSVAFINELRWWRDQTRDLHEAS